MSLKKTQNEIERKCECGYKLDLSAFAGWYQCQRCGQKYGPSLEVKHAGANQILETKHVENLWENSLADKMEQEIFIIINKFMNAGVTKPDCVKKMKWIAGNVEMS